MRFAGWALLMVCAWWPVLGAAQNTIETEKIADLMVRLCVGGGHTEATGGTATGGADLSLRSLDVKGNLKGSSKSASRVPRVWSTVSTPGTDMSQVQRILPTEVVGLSGISCGGWA